MQDNGGVKATDEIEEDVVVQEANRVKENSAIKENTIAKGVTKLKVTILEDVYSLKGDGDEQHITMLAAFVDKKMRQVKERNPHLSTAKIAVLTALNISDELSKLQEDYDALVKIIQAGEKIRK